MQLEAARLTSKMRCRHPGNVLIRPMPGKGSTRPQVVILDHGLYKQLDDEFRLDYCLLWKALVFGEVDVIRQQCQRFGAGDLYPLLAAMITARPWNNIIDPNVASLVVSLLPIPCDAPWR